MLAARIYRATPCRTVLPRYSTTAHTFKVVLDGNTLYVDQRLAEALGWTHDAPSTGVPLTLAGWEPSYFAITQKDSNEEQLVQATIERFRNPRVQAVLQALKDSDSGESPSEKV